MSTLAAKIEHFKNTELDESNRTPASQNVYLPENWLCPEILASRRDEAAWFVSRLYFRHHFHRLTGDSVGYPVWWKINREMMGHDYADTVDALVKSGDVQVVREYQMPKGSNAAGRCREYLLAEHLVSAKFRRDHFRSPEFRKRLDREAVDTLHSDPVYQGLRGWLYRLEIAADAPCEKSLSLAVLKDRCPFMTVCRMGRVHTPLTNLHREYRRFVRYCGEPLWNVDVRTSQPLLNGVAAMLGRTPEPIAEYARRLDPTGKHNKTGHVFQKYVQTTTGSMGVSCDGRRGVVRAGVGVAGDELQLIATCTDPAKDLYRDFVVYDTERGFELTRDDAKGLLLPAFYDHNDRLDGDYCFHDAATLAVRRLFAGKYPNVVAFLRQRNELNPLHGEAARFAQTLESFAVINLASRRFLSERPAAPLLTIHDSLVTVESHVGFAEEVLRGSFESAFGVTPVLKASSFGVN